MKKDKKLGRPISIKAKDAKRSRTVSLSDNQVSNIIKEYKSLTNALVCLDLKITEDRLSNEEIKF